MACTLLDLLPASSLYPLEFILHPFGYSGEPSIAGLLFLIATILIQICCSVRKTYDGTLLMANTTLLLSFWSTTFFFINLITLWFLLHSVRGRFFDFDPNR